MRFFSLLALLFLLPLSVDAATLYLSPSSGSYTVGKPFTVNVYVASADQAMNAVASDVSVSSDTLSIVSASSVGSIVNFWVEQPSVAGSTLSFEGVVMNPGYQGGGAKVASFVLMPKRAGTGSVTFSSASVLANDGQGTAILSSAASGSFTIKDAPVAPPVTPAPVVEEKEEEVEEEPEEAVSPPPATDVAEAPRVTDYDFEVSFGELVALRGVTYEDALVELLVYQDGVLVTSEYANSNTLGDFSIVIAKRLDAGRYELRVRVTTPEGLTSAESESFPLHVKASVLDALGSLTIGHLALLALMILAAIGVLSVMHAVGFQRLFKLTREIHARESESADVTRRVFDILKKDLSTHVRKMRAASDDRILTKEELEFLAEFEEELAEAEEVLKQPKRPRVRKAKIKTDA